MAAAAVPALAVNVGGLEIPAGPVFAVSQIYSSTPTTVGQELLAYGKVDSINSTPIANLCTDCELTYRVSGYTVASVSSTNVLANNGTIQFYLGTGATKDFSTTNAGGLAGDITEATNGQAFMTLKGHAINATGNTFSTTIGTAGSAFGTGLADVDTSVAGLANAVFNTNGIAAQFGGPADLQLNASWTSIDPLYAGQGACGATGCVRGSADFHAVAVPEPETYALMLSALGLIGYVVNRRRRS